MKPSWLVALVLAGCAAEPELPVPPENEDTGVAAGGKEDSPGPSWTSIGLGVSYQQVNSGHAILIAYGGYSARLSYSAAWATELVDAKLGALDVGHIYAVKGPADPGYSSREIANTKLRAHLATIDDGQAPIYVVGHSSGSYVAHELLAQLHAAGKTDLLARIGYADLDGGGEGLTQGIVDELHAITFVYAHDPASGYSENHTTAVALGDDYAPHAATYKVEVTGSGCTSGAGWCMHDVLITHKPHNHNTYDLARDYTDFVNRPVTIEYLDSLAP
jgi:hypothetical protein